MKQLFMLVAAITVSSSCLAGSNQLDSSLNSLSTAWRNQHTTIQAQQVQNDLTMVYGGEDVSHKPLASHKTTV